MRKIIGIAGKIASGKGVAAEHSMRAYHATCIDYSQFLYQALDIFSLPHERKNINALSIFLRAAYGQDVLSRAVLRELSTREDELVVLTGIRRLPELEDLSKIPDFTFVYIDSDIHKRYQRNQSTARKPGDATMTFEEFVQKDSDDSNSTIEGLKERTDYVIENNGTREEFLCEFDSVIAKIIS